MNDPKRKNCRLLVTPNLKVDLVRASTPQPSRFLLGGYSDEDSGGRVLAKVTESLEVCIPEKEKKIAKVRCKYPEWWLVLIDYVGYGRLDPIDLQHLRDSPPVAHTWDKIVLVNPLQPEQGFEI